MRMRLLTRLFILTAVAIACIAGGLGIIGYDIYRAGPLPEETQIWIKKGQGLHSIAQEWSRDGIIAYPVTFKLVIFLKDIKIKAGEYNIPPRASIDTITRILKNGKPILRKITIPEGLSNNEIYEVLRSSPYMTGAIPEDFIFEGNLLPETYFFERGEERTALLSRMAQGMEEKVKTLWNERDPDLPLQNPTQLITLASIVEKETSRSSERARIAGVFYNRLKKGMKLQTDPTIIYALTNGKGKLGRTLTREDLAFDHLYNTYLHEGLPPGPIANPGEASLRAVVHPLTSKELYFVADGTGGHAFAETLDAHNRNVAKWRKVQKDQIP